MLNPRVRFTVAGILIAGLLTAGFFAQTSRRRSDTAVTRGDVARADGDHAATGPQVEVAYAEQGSSARIVRLSGLLKSGSTAAVASRLGGRILAISVQEGQRVARGDLLLRLDDREIRGQGAQASATVSAAKAALDKAREAARMREAESTRRIEDAQQVAAIAAIQVSRAEGAARLQTSTSLGEVKRAQAGVDAARAGLDRLRKGAPAATRRQAAISAEQARRAVDLARRGAEDAQFLFDKGAYSRIQLEGAREELRKAEDGLAQARAQQELANAAPTAEEIAGAEAQVRQAEAALEQARSAADREALNRQEVAAARTELRRAEAGVRAAREARAEVRLARADVRAAEAAWMQAVAGARQASIHLEDSTVRSPVDGTVTSVRAHAGELAAPGAPLVEVVGATGAYLEAAAPARHQDSLRAGQTARVVLDALPKQAFAGIIRSVSRVATSDGRSFPVRIELTGPPEQLRPGGLARAEVRTDSMETVIQVPPECLRTEGERVSVWVVRGGRLVVEPVEVRKQEARTPWILTQIVGSVAPGEPVVIHAPQGIRPGDRVSVRGSGVPVGGALPRAVSQGAR